jgi:hypothetical protein
MVRISSVFSLYLATNGPNLGISVAFFNFELKNFGPIERFASLFPVCWQFFFKFLRFKFSVFHK